MTKRKTLLVLCGILAAFLFLGGWSAFTSIPFEPVVKGRDLGNPIDLAKLKSCIQRSLIQFDWRVVSETDGSIAAEYTKDGGKVHASIKVGYSASGYQIEYVDSIGLDVDMEKMKIHRNYMRWVRNLEKQIATTYYE